MILYVLIAAFLAGGVGGGWAVNSYRDLQQARQVRALESAQKRVDEITVKLTEEAANKIVDMQAAFDAGEAQQKIVTKTVFVKGQDYVREAPQVFANPNCVLPAPSLQLYNSEVERVRTAATEALGLSAPGTPANGSDGGSVHIVPRSAGPIPGVHQELQPVPSALGIPGGSVQRPQKPRAAGG